MNKSTDKNMWLIFYRHCMYFQCRIPKSFKLSIPHEMQELASWGFKIKQALASLFLNLHTNAPPIKQNYKMLAFTGVFYPYMYATSVCSGPGYKLNSSLKFLRRQKQYNHSMRIFSYRTTRSSRSDVASYPGVPIWRSGEEERLVHTCSVHAFNFEPVIT